MEDLFHGYPPGSSTTYEPLKSMLTTICGHQVAHPTQTRPLLPPVYILHRTSTNPPHFNATKQTKKQTHIDPKRPSRPLNPGEREPPRQPEIETIPPTAAKRPKTSPPPQSPVSPSLCAVTWTSEETPGTGRSIHTGDTDDKNGNGIDMARPTKRVTQPLTTAEQTAKTKALTRETQNKKDLQGPKESMQTTGTERPRAKGKIGNEGTSRSRIEATRISEFHLRSR